MVIAYVLLFIICVLLILIVLVQNSKGGGLAAGFTGSQIMGVRKTADFLEKATWTLAGVLITVCIVSNIVFPRQRAGSQRSVLQDEIQNAVNPNAAPKVPVIPTKETNQGTFPAPAKNSKKR